MSESLNNKKLLFLVIPLAFVSCVSVEDTLTDQAMSQAESNASEIEKVLNSYDGEKKEAAEYLVRGMLGQYSLTGPGLDSIEQLYKKLPQPNGRWQLDSLQLAEGKRYEIMPRNKVMDLKTLSADFLLQNISDFQHVSNLRSWNKNFERKELYETLLPYRIGDEPVTEWRDAYRKALDSISPEIDKATTSVEAARYISKAVGEIRYNIQLNIPHRSALALLDSPVGYCREECDRTLHAMRAFGIPGAIDAILVSPDNGTSHQWTVVLDNVDHIFRMFDNGKYPPTRDSLHYDGRRKGKVYRNMFMPDRDKLAKYRRMHDAPYELMNPRLKDVTAEYFGHNEAKVKVNVKSGTVFLGIFTPQGYKPIDMAIKVKRGIAIFQDIEPDLIYFPIIRNGSEYRTCGNPFMLESNGNVHDFIPDSYRKETVAMKRKMPFWLHLIRGMSSVVGIKTQTGSTPAGPWDDVDSITSVPSHNFYRIPVNLNKKNRYIRLLTSPMHDARIGEVLVSVDSLASQCVPLSLITDTPSEKKNKLVDRDILSWTLIDKDSVDLVFRINSDEYVSSIFIIPQNDDNYVVPGEEYELFYFDRDEWKSLGKKTAEGFDITYDVPANAVLWLRNLSKGKEEQIFICRDGRQLFNADLGAARLELNLNSF